MDINQNTYKSDESVKYYGSLTDIQRPEQVVFDRLKANWAQKKVLDIGVGGGRTTPLWAPLAKEYVGLDYSNEMIDFCKKRFGEKYKFITGDARNLSAFPDRYFDFVTFSFNGIDSVNHQDRMQILKEAHRVMNPSGHFLFSSHNINYDLTDKHSIRWMGGFRRQIQNFRNWYRFRLRNSNYQSRRTLPFELFYDGAQSFRLLIYYISADEQIRQLKDCGFKNIEIIDLTNGRTLTLDEARTTKDAWLHYLCN